MDSVIQDLKAGSTKLVDEIESASRKGDPEVLQKLQQAKQSLDSRVKTLEESRPSSLRPLSAVEEKLNKQGYSAFADFLEKTGNEALRELDSALASSSLQKLGSARSRFESLRGTQEIVSSLDETARAKVIEAVSRHVAESGRDNELARGLKSADAGNLAPALRKTGAVLAAAGSSDPRLARAVSREAKLTPEQQAIADAVGAMGPATTKSSFQRRAEAIVDTGQLKKDVAALEAKAAKADGRSLASVPDPKESIEAIAKRRLESMKGNMDPDELELYESAFKHAIAAEKNGMPREAAWEKA